MLSKLREKLTPEWCRYCDRPAVYSAEARNGMEVFVCSIKRHNNHLTGAYQGLRSLLGFIKREINK